MPEYISRDLVLADIEQTIEDSGCVNHERDIIDCVRYATAADVVEVVHARWWPDNMDAGCTNCGSGMPRNPDGSQEESEYCPNCGAKMDGGENHAD